MKLNEKIMVVGTSCTGKSTLAAQIGERLQMTHFDLDELHWMPNWETRPAPELRQILFERVLPLSRWVLSGNYTTAGRDNIWRDVQTLIWLDLSLFTTLKRYVKRTYRRIRYKELCCNGNIETLRSSIFTHEILLKYILKAHFFTRRPLYKRWMKNEMHDKHWIVLRSPKEVEAFLQNLTSDHRTG